MLMSIHIRSKMQLKGQNNNNSLCSFSIVQVVKYLIKRKNGRVNKERNKKEGKGTKEER